MTDKTVSVPQRVYLGEFWGTAEIQTQPEPISISTESRPRKCPTCDSPAPERHPAMQFEGEVQMCKDEWHNFGDGKQYAASSSLLPVRQQIDIQELRLEGKGTDHIWLMEDGAEPHTIGIRLDSGDSGVVYVTPNQAKDLAEQLTAITSVASLPVGESRHAFPDAFTIEVELEDDGRWLAEVDEVPGAMAYGSQPSDAILAVLEIAKIENRAGLGESREPLPLSPSEHLIVLHRRFRAAWLRQGDLTDPEQQKAEHEEMIRLSDEIRDLELPSVPAEIESTEPKEPR